MNDVNETKEQLLEEIENLRARVAELEASQAGLEQAKKALSESEERYRALFENIPVETIVVDSDGKITAINLAKRTARSRKPKIGESMYVDYAGKHKHDMRGELMDCISSGKSKEFPKQKYGDRILVIKMSPFPGGAVVTSEDITERKRAGEALRESEERYRMHFENVGDVIYVTDKEFCIVDVSPSVKTLLGYNPEELIGHRIDEVNIIPPEYYSQAISHTAKVLAGEKSGPTEYEFIAKDGERKIGEVIGTPLIKSGKIIGIVSVGRDVTDRKLAEEALKESEERYKTVVDNFFTGICIHQGGKLQFVNRQMVEWSGYTSEELLGMPMADLIHPHDRETLRERTTQRMAGEDPDSRNYYRAINKAGEIRWIETFGTIIDYHGRPAILSNIVDITERKQVEEERKRLEEQLRHKQKLESIGTLAGGIAHDFNNLLTSVLGNTELALMRLPHFSPARNNLEEISRAARRAADLCSQMLAYSGRGQFVVQPVDLTKLVWEMSSLLEVSISKKVKLRYALDSEVSAIEADSAQIHQIVMNLITNASEAIGDEPGVISLSTGSMQCDREYFADTYLGEELPEGMYAHVEVSDTGCGMDDETVAKIFDPFFTTKFTGRGLGLAAVLGIIRGHKGTIKIQSEPEKGTTIRALFPCGDKPVDTGEDGGTGKEEWRGSGTVLLVDDEESVRRVAKNMLEEIGFTVLTATDGQQAVDVYQENKGKVVLVLLDMTMPKKSGEDAFVEIKQMDDNARVILSSGYEEQDVTKRFAGQGLVGFIHKPYKFEVLQKIIRQVLEN